MRYKVIVNPKAGRGLGAHATPTIRRLLSEHGLDFDLTQTSCAGEAIELARRATLDSYDVIVAAGGDGTYQEAINGMVAAHAENAPEDGVIGTLGILPVGSGCDFSYAAGVPCDLEDACARLAEGEPRLVDLGRVTVYRSEQDPGTCRYFDNTVGIGFDGVVTMESRKLKHLRGMALYLPVVLKTVFVSLKPPRAVIEYEEALPDVPSRRPRPMGTPAAGSPTEARGEAWPPPLEDEGERPARRTGQQRGPIRRIEKTILMATICNGQREGGGFYVAPEARNDDGLLDLLLADNLPRLQILGMIPHFMKGTHVDKPSVTMLRSRRITITSPDPLIAHADGEMLCTDGHRIECEIAAQRVRVIG